MKRLVPIVLVVLLAYPLYQAFAFFEDNRPWQGGPWPDGEITYYNDSGYQKTLEAAIDQWEQVGLPVHFVETDDRSSADLVIHDDENLLDQQCQTESGCRGHADIGYSVFRQADLYMLPANEEYEDRIQSEVRMPTMIHELGHVLGLKHTDEPCSIMNSSSVCRELSRARVDSEGTSYMCGPWDTDVLAVRELYGVTGDDVGPVSPYCDDPEATTAFWKQDYHYQTLANSLFITILPK